MFYLLILPSLVLSVFVVSSLLRIKKHDRVLYNFCQIRRDAISLIDSRGDDLSKIGYYSVRNLLNSLNLMIHNYEGCKTHIFNVRKLVQLLNDYKHITRQAEKIVTPDDSEIVELHRRFRRSMVNAFLAYTPLIRSEIAARMFLMLLTFFAKSGMKPVKKLAENLKWLVDQMGDDHHHNGALTA